MKSSIEITNILREFHKISGFRVSIHNTEFHELYAYPQKLSSYCSIIQHDFYNKKKCIQNDRLTFEKVKETGEVIVYKCHHGLYEAVAPIYHYGILAGFLMMGQVCDNKQKQSLQLKESLKRVVNEEKRINEILKNIKEVPSELLDSYILLMKVIAEYVTQTNTLFLGNGNQAELIMKYIKQNYASKITLDILAKKFSRSHSMLAKCFKKEYGTTIMNALMDVRLNKAAEHLKNGSLSIKEISAECGFAEQNYFSKAFFKKYNCSPSEYRKAVQ